MTLTPSYCPHPTPHTPPHTYYTHTQRPDVRNYDEAIRSFSHVIRLDRNHVDALFNLAVAYQDRASSFPDHLTRQKYLANAMKCYQEVVRKCPETQDAASAANSLITFLQTSAESKEVRSRSTSATSSSSSSSSSSATTKQPLQQLR